MKEILLKTATTESVIRCGEGVFAEYAPRLADEQLFIVTDSNVFAYYRYRLWETFGEFVPIYIIPAGERSKNIRYLTAILKEMLKSGMKRNCTVVAFGGGVVGDIAGLAASLYMRGVKLVQVPTTLLAQVDSSVGGKTAIDFEGVKNAIGAFYQPREVIADPAFFETLTEREVRCGWGEIIKTSALNGEIYDLLVKNTDKFADKDFLSGIIAMCIEHKARVVEADEKETTGLRKTLNLGHTTGHALELYYRKKSHGEYVLIGMYYELYIAMKKGVCDKNYAASLIGLIKKIVNKIPSYPDIAEACKLAAYDKKNSDSRISVIVPAQIGRTEEIKLGMDEYVSLVKECSETLRRAYGI